MSHFRFGNDSFYLENAHFMSISDMDILKNDKNYLN